MAVSLQKARDFVYDNGRLWERALFGYLFENQPLAHLHQCLLCYKNADGGWAHGLEHDIKTPDSHPLALEFLLAALVRDLDVPVRAILDGTPAWLENHRFIDGSLKNPLSVFDYPHAPWWNEGGQTAPDSIVGNLRKIGMSTPSLDASTRAWVQKNLTLDTVQSNEWLFMAYHAYDYYLNTPDFPNIELYRSATIRNIIDCAEHMTERQYFVLFQFAPTADSPVAQATPHLVERSLDYVLSTQRDDGGWDDEHNLLYWQPYMNLIVLRALQRYGKLESLLLAV